MRVHERIGSDSFHFARKFEVVLVFMRHLFVLKFCLINSEHSEYVTCRGSDPMTVINGDDVENSSTSTSKFGAELFERFQYNFFEFCHNSDTILPLNVPCLRTSFGYLHSIATFDTVQESHLPVLPPNWSEAKEDPNPQLS